MKILQDCALRDYEKPSLYKYPVKIQNRSKKKRSKAIIGLTSCKTFKY